MKTGGQQQITGLNRLVNICLGQTIIKKSPFLVWGFEFCLFGVLSLLVFCLSSSANEFPIRTLGKQSRLSAFTISRSRRSWQWKGILVPELLHSFRSFSSYEYKSLKNSLCLWIYFFGKLHHHTPKSAQATVAQLSIFLPLHSVKKIS